MDREDPLDTNAKADLANGEGRSGSVPTISGDNHTLECLDTFTPTFNDSDLDNNSVARCKVREVIAQLCCFDLLDRVHGILRRNGEVNEAGIL